MFKNNLFAVKELQDLLAEKKAEHKSSAKPNQTRNSTAKTKSAAKSTTPVQELPRTQPKQTEEKSSTRQWILRMIDQAGKTQPANFEKYLKCPEQYQLQVLVHGEYQQLEYCQDLALLNSLPLLNDPKIVNATAPFCIGEHCGCVIAGQRINHKLEQGILLKSEDNKGFIRSLTPKRNSKAQTIAIRSPELKFYCNNDIVNYVAYDYKGYAKAQIKGLQQGETETILVKITNLSPLTVSYGDNFTFTAAAVTDKTQLSVYQQSSDKFISLLREVEQTEHAENSLVTLKQEEDTWYKFNLAPASELSKSLKQQDLYHLNNLTLGSYWLAKIDFRKEQHQRKELIFTLLNYVGEADLYLPKLFAELRKEELPLFTLPLVAEDKEVFINGTDQGERKNFLQLPFVSIDGPFTTDIDDAVFAIDLTSSEENPAALTRSAYFTAQEITEEQAKLSPFYPHYLASQSVDSSAPDSVANFIQYQFTDPQLQELNNLVLPASATSLLAVAIADPSYYVAKDSHTDAIAEDLFITLYLPGRNINIFPNQISEYNATLLENKPCPSIIAFIGLDERGEPISLNLQIAWVKVKANLTYQEDDLLISNGEAILNPASVLDSSSEQALLHYSFRDSYNAMRKLWLQSQAYYQSIGKVIQQNNSNVKYFIPEGEKEVTQTYIPPNSDSFQVIARAMSVFNQITSQYTKAQGIPTLYSVNPSFGATALICKTQDSPYDIYNLSNTVNTDLTETRETSLQEKLATSIQALKNSLIAISNNYSQVLPMLDHREKEKVFSLQKHYADAQQLATLTQAQDSLRYNATLLTPEPSPHFAMGQEVYATFTSPIRRFTDLVNIRNLKAKLWGLEPAYSQAELYKYIHKNDYRKRNNRLMRSLETEFVTNIFKANSAPRTNLTLPEIELLSRQHLLKLIQQLKDKNGGELSKATIEVD